MDLRIDYGATREVGSQVIQKGEEFQDLLNKIKSVNSELQSYWQGQDAQHYSQKVEDQAGEMQKLQQVIKEVGEFLMKVANAYEEVSHNNMGQ